jgi:hypothetical protein
MRLWINSGSAREEDRLLWLAFVQSDKRSSGMCTLVPLEVTLANDRSATF